MVFRMLRNGELLRRSEMEVYFLQEKGRLPTMDELDALVAPEGYDGRVSYSVPGGDHLNLTTEARPREFTPGSVQLRESSM